MMSQDGEFSVAHIVIIVGHARTGTFCEALGEAYARGAEVGGHQAKLFVTGRMTFNPILHEGFERVQPLEDDLQAAHDAIIAADHLVFIFPLWMGSMPAILKGFLERVFQSDLVGPSKQGKFPKFLKGKSARVVITMGMPSLVYRWWFGAHALKILKHNIFPLVGVHPTRSLIYGNVEGVGLAGRRRWLKQLEKLGRRAI
jgi:NAD(P)H dehydrogenase (quinone)